MDDGRVVFSIQGDNRDLRQTLTQTTDAIERESKNWDRAANQSSDNMSAAFGKAFNVERVKNFAIQAGKALLQLGKDAVEAASNLQEVQNVVDTTFGEYAGKIDSWAKSAAANFGLTETQAKKFTSTLGAMAKSAGLAGPEIVTMSTDLAGLAADMASFYNLDFDTAFQKIRSGISGQTMPLKELGINMSEAALNAFALQQGLTKTFSQMSQGEQIMLRYQYIMQATSDAQGDFARTSDGFANSMRLLETNIESLKTKLGEVLLPVVGEVVGAINDMVGELTQNPNRTILDDFAEIDLQTSTKLAEIESTATKANDLIRILEQINAFTITDKGEAAYLGDLAGGVNSLQNSKPRLWKGLIDALDDAAFSSELNATTAKNIEDVADSANELSITAYGNWGKLGTSLSGFEISDDLDSTNNMGTIAADANSLDSTASGKWDKLKSSLKDFAISDDLKGSTNMGTIAADANSLEVTASGRWDKLMVALNNTGGLAGLADAGTNIEALSTAINSEGASTDKAEAWKTLLTTLASNAGALTSLTGDSAEGTKAWLETLAAGANTLDPASAEGWDKLRKSFEEGFTGGDSEQVLGSFFGASGEYAEYLAALGIESDQVADAQALWLNICRQLVSVIPGLSSIINTETGQVEGGTQALRDYVDAWKETEMLQATLSDIEKKRQAVYDQYGNRYELYAKYLVAQAKKRAAGEALTMMGMTEAEENAIRARWEGQKLSSVYGTGLGGLGGDDERSLALWDWDQATKEADAAKKAYDDYMDAMAKSLEILQEEEDAVKEKMGETSAETQQAAESFYLTGDAATAATNAMTGLGETLKAINDYYDETRQATESAVRSVVNGFGSIESPAERARAEFRNLNKELADLSDAEIDIKLRGDDSVPTAANMLAGLNDQIAYMEEYQRRLIIARQMGFSEELLGSLGDGSLESYDYLGALVGTINQVTGKREGGASEDQIQQINDAYAAVETGKEKFTDMLTMQKLKADEVFQGLVDDADAMITSLDLSDGAQTAMESTLQGLVNGIAAKMPDLTTEVDLVLEQLARLNSATGFNFERGHIFTSFAYTSGILDGQHANGLDYVPFDGYLAGLHEGESVLTEAEARVWRNFKYGQASTSNSIDYDALGGVMRDNISAGGNVYLDGRTVGRVISASQANSFRNLERSGWQG